MDEYNYDIFEQKEENKKSSRRPSEMSPKANFALTLILSLLALTYIYPVLVVIMTSFATSRSMTYKGYTIFPLELSVESYKYLLLGGRQVIKSYEVTIARSVIGPALSLLVTTLYAYAVSDRKFPCRKFYTYFIFFASVFSGGMVASFIINVRYLHLYDSFFIYILPGLVGWGSVVTLRTFIRTMVPDAMIEAAKVDGASHFRIYLQICMPVLQAGIATFLFGAVVGHWNEWFTACLYIENPDLVPIQTMLQKIQANIDFIKENAGLMGTHDQETALKDMPTESTQMAITVIATAPIMCVYPFFQKYFIRGVVAGSVKE